MDLFGYTSMNALSWKQPFGTAMLREKVETRTWDTNYRGNVLICTSKLPYNEETVRSICGDYQYGRLLEALRKVPETLDMDGFAIAVGELVHSRPMRPEDEDKTFVKYRPDLFCHFYKDVRRIQPIPWVGSVGWLKVTPEFSSRIQYLDAA